MKCSESPLVSVIVPTIPSRKELLKRAVTSIKSQTYKNIEIIIVDEGKPATVQRNIGIERSKGKYIAFLDDDDEWKLTKIEKQVKFMEEHPDSFLVIHWSYDKRVGKGRINKPPIRIWYKDLIKGFQLSSTSSYLVRTICINKIKDIYGYVYDKSLPTGQEYDLALRLSKHFGEIYCLQEILMIQHKTPNQISSDWGKKIRGQYRFIEKYGKEYSILDYCKRIGLIGLFFGGYFVGNYIMYIINFAKTRFEEK